jgi:hypothetical protein
MQEEDEPRPSRAIIFLFLHPAIRERGVRNFSLNRDSRSKVT